MFQLPQSMAPQVPCVYGQLSQLLHQQMAVQQQPQYGQQEDRGALFEAGLPGPQIQRLAQIHNHYNLRKNDNFKVYK